jgi:hypothetical protein
LFLVLLVGLIFPFPLAVHCLFLTLLNRRPHPVVVAGVWDFAEVLFALSGFLLFGGPSILGGFSERYREYLLYGGLRQTPRLTDAVSHVWVAVWVGYFVIVVAVAGFFLWRRRRATSVYNVEPEAFHECLAAVLDGLKLEWVRNGDRVFIGAPAAGAEAERPWSAARHGLVLQLDVFPAMRHVSLWWPADAGPLRSEIEGRLASAFAEVRTHGNPVGGWLLSIAGCLFSVMFFTVAAVGFAIYAATKG